MTLSVHKMKMFNIWVTFICISLSFVLEFVWSKVNKHEKYMYSFVTFMFLSKIKFLFIADITSGTDGTDTWNVHLENF
jgi:hypothetical protein